MAELKPCPWCPNGGQPQVSTSFAYAYVECIGCGAQGPDVAADCASVEEYEAEAVAAWNRRSYIESVPSPGSDPVEAFRRLAEDLRAAPPSPGESREPGGGDGE